MMGIFEEVEEWKESNEKVLPEKLSKVQNKMEQRSWQMEIMAKLQSVRSRDAVERRWRENETGENCYDF